MNTNERFEVNRKTHWRCSPFLNWTAPNVHHYCGVQPRHNSITMNRREEEKKTEGTQKKQKKKKRTQPNSLFLSGNWEKLNYFIYSCFLPVLMLFFPMDADEKKNRPRGRERKRMYFFLFERRTVVLFIKHRAELWVNILGLHTHLRVCLLPSHKIKIENEIIVGFGEWVYVLQWAVHFIDPIQQTLFWPSSKWEISSNNDWNTHRIEFVEWATHQPILTPHADFEAFTKRLKHQP